MGVGIFSAQYLALIHEGIAPGPASPLLVRADWSDLMHAILAPHNFIPNFYAEDQAAADIKTTTTT